ncbi:UNVERIFIED_CONTAM: hypothetical protein GTU68_055877 [Idotea baltica]|nr:hypothetical protein [Idotea baltica]
MIKELVKSVLTETHGFKHPISINFISNPFG